MLGALIYLSFYGLYMFYNYLKLWFEKIVNYIYKKRDNKITLISLKEELNEFKEELDFLDGWKIIQKKDNKKLNDEIIMLKKDNNLIINKLRNEILDLKNSMNTLSMNLEKKINSNISNKFYDIKNTNDLEFKEMNNKIFKIKCMVDK
jgi:hypothetical protein